MKRRRSILLDPELDRRVERCARERGVTYTDFVREVLEAHLGEPEENPNQWLLDLAEEIRQIGEREGFPDVPRMPIDSDEGRQQMARDLWRREMGREPDW